MRAWKTRGVALVSAMLAVASAVARESAPTEWPLERIVTNLEAQLAQSPNDPQIEYSLGRAHGFAFALETPSLSVRGNWVDDIARQHRATDQPRPTDAA